MKLTSIPLLFGTIYSVTNVCSMSFRVTTNSSSRILSIYIRKGKPNFELLAKAGSSIIQQVDNYCHKNKITGLNCPDIFVRTLQSCYRERIKLEIPLYICFDKVIRNCTDANFTVTFDGGPLYYQINKFLSANKCSNSTRDHILKTILVKGEYWFPSSVIVLYKASSMGISTSSVNMSKIGIIEPGWESIIEKIRLTLHRRKHYSHRLELSKSRRRVYYGIFAGRLLHMPIHFAYTDLLLDAHLVTEVHIWDFTSNAQDAEYLYTFVRESTRDGYRLFKRPSTDNSPDAGINSGYLFQSFYSHYASNKRYHSDDIIIKADDDLVFIDISNFDLFLNNISNKHLHFPDVVNNDVGFVIQGNRNAHLSSNIILEAYTGLGRNFDVHMKTFIATERTGSLKVCPLSAIFCNDTVWRENDWRLGLYSDGIIARMIHEAFLENPFQFIMKCLSSGERFVDLNRRISINMFATKISYFRIVFNMFLKSNYDDESYIATWPTMSKDSHIIDTHFTVAHFAFENQRRTYDGNISADLERYARIVSAISKF